MCSWDNTGYKAYELRKPKEFNDEVRVSLEKLDGSTRSAVALLTNMSVRELDTYGGLPED